MLSKTSLAIGLCSFANFINAADRVIMPIAIIQMTDEFNWHMHNQGWILSSFSIGYMSSQVLGGTCAKRYGGKLILTVSVFLWSLSTFLTPFFAHSFPALILSRVSLGVGEGLGLPTIFHIFAHTVPVEERSRAFGYLVAFGSIGQTIAAVVLPHMHWPWMFYIFGFLGFIWVFFWLCLYQPISESTRSVGLDNPPVDSSSKASLLGFKEDSSYNTLNSQSTSITSSTNNIRYIELISHWPLWAIYTAHFSMNWSNYIMMQWLPTYLSRALGADPHTLMFTALPYILNSIASAAAGHLADKMVSQQWTILSVRRLMTTVGLLGPGFFILIFSGISSLPFALSLVSISMALSAFNSPGHLSNHADVAPSHAGLTFGVSNTLATIPGILCGPLTAELVTSSHGRWFPVFIIAALVNFVGAVVYLTHSTASQVI